MYNSIQHVVILSHAGWSFSSILRPFRELGFSKEHQLLQCEASTRPFKCFTCDNAVDNYNCNRWAEDRWCPESTQYCLTVHLFTDHGKSTSVTKKCATGEECHFVGCHHHRESGHTECVSCCEGMICNVEIPTNHTNAVFAVLHARRTSDGSRWTVNIAVLVSVVMIALS
ncbi:ly6/PLAUR domain-containing protein 6B isoform X2 [Anser cygnoides]|uniref:ly6/PLAUR domain-containing protein 6B isoform X2 n=1 Tax=Anser cygnoides TaxID=8845 RepID=UPI0034D27832